MPFPPKIICAIHLARGKCVVEVINLTLCTFHWRKIGKL